MTYTIGIDIGSGAVKTVLFRTTTTGRPNGWPSAASASAAATP
jgi:sugar (pentulose or hexulose) kinase